MTVTLKNEEVILATLEKVTNLIAKRRKRSGTSAFSLEKVLDMDSKTRTTRSMRKSCQRCSRNELKTNSSKNSTK